MFCFVFCLFYFVFGVWGGGEGGGVGLICSELHCKMLLFLACFQEEEEYTSYKCDTVFVKIT